MKRTCFSGKTLFRERGAVLVLVGVLMFVFVGITALAIDVGHLYVVHNELQNAADAGALAGARNLFSDDGEQILAGANQISHATATQNSSGKDATTQQDLAVEVDWASGNTGDVQRGHWSFSEKKFTPDDSLTPISLAGMPTSQLDIMDGTTAARQPVCINAVKVTARRESTPAPSFFAGVFGFDSFIRTAEAVGYIGYSGRLEPGEADQPIAICQESILQTDANGQEFYSCNIGRMINSGSKVSSSETGGWTDFNQDSPCNGGTNSVDVRNQVCSSGNISPIQFGEKIATNGGEIQSAFKDLLQCWQDYLAQSRQDTGSNQPWELTLPVVTCPGNNVSTCETVVGAVTVFVVWINEKLDPHYDEAPTEMFNPATNQVWSNADADGQIRWQDFVQAFNLQNVDGTPAPYNQKSIYFLPSCEVSAPKGHTGGKNFGVRAKYPVLVD